LLASLANEHGLSHPIFTSSAEDPAAVEGTKTHLVTYTVQASVDDSQKPAPLAAPAAATSTAGSSTAATPTTTTPAGH